MFKILYKRIVKHVQFIIFEERNEDEEERTENRLIDKICVTLSCNFTQGEIIACQYRIQYLNIAFWLVISNLVLYPILDFIKNFLDDLQAISNDVDIYYRCRQPHYILMGYNSVIWNYVINKKIALPFSHDIANIRQHVPSCKRSCLSIGCL